MNKKLFIFVIITLILLGLIVYSNSFFNDFVWDDEALIIENESIKDISNWHNILTQELINDSRTNYYRPLQAFSYMLDYAIFGLKAPGYHLTNFLLHVLNSILVLFLLYVICKNKIIASFAAILFVVHPLHTQSVSYISGRADLLAGFFMLATFILYIRHFENYRFKNALYLFSILSFTLALFSKEMSIIMPVAIIAYDLFFRRQIKGKFMRLLPFLLIGIFYIVLRLSILNFSSLLLWDKAAIYSPTNTIRILSFLKGIVVYLWILILPINLHMERYIVPATKIFNIYVLLTLLIVIVCLIIFKRVRFANKKLIFFGATWFFIFLFPQSNFFFPSIVGEHYLYLPSIGIFLIFACLLNSLYIKRRYFTRSLFAIIIVFLGLLTFSQNYVWRNSLTFYHWTDKYAPESYMARNNLANIYAYLAMDDLAIEKYEQALMVNPNMNLIKENLSFVEDNMIVKYSDILKSIPRKSTIHYYNLAYLYERKQKFDEAISYYERAIELSPKFATAIVNLGNVYQKTGEDDKALEKYNQAISVDSKFAKAYFNIGVVLANQGKLDEAKVYFQKALDIDPDYEKAENALFRANKVVEARPQQ